LKKSELFRSKTFKMLLLKKFKKRKSKNLLTRSGLNMIRTTQVSSLPAK
jgi:hypothetical protein